MTTLGVACRVLLAGICFVLVAGFAISPALACTCSIGAKVIWPAADSTAADRELAIVVQLMGLERDAIRVRLSSSDGVEVPVEVERVLRYTSGCNQEVVFLHPIEVLSADTSYQIVVEPGRQGTDAGDTTLAKRLLVTGSSTRTEPEPEPLSVAYLHVLAFEGERCGFKPCQDQAELQLDPPDDDLATPSWVAMRVGDSDEIEAVVQRGGTNGVNHLAVLAAKLPEDETCVSYEWIDLRGKLRRHEELCQPGRCFVLKHEGAIPGNSCGDGAFPVSAGAWDDLPEDSCKNPPLRIADPGGEGTTEPASKGVAESGCSTSVQRRVGTGAWMLLGALALLVRRRRVPGQSRGVQSSRPNWKKRSIRAPSKW